MTRSFFTMKAARVIAILALHSMVLIHADSTQATSEILVRPPMFRKSCQPQDKVMVFENSKEIFIPCQPYDTTANSEYTYRWEKDGQNTTLENTKADKDCPVGLLIKSQTDGSSAGTYQCFISNEKGTAMSNVVTYREIGSLESIKRTRQMTANAGIPFKLYCELPANAKLLDKSKWGQLKDGLAESLEDDPRYTQDENGTLWISETQQKDQRTYIYRLITADGETDVCKTVLKITEKGQPIKDIKLQFKSNINEFVELEQKKRLFCIYDGKIEVKWSKNGVSLQSEGKIKIVTSQQSLEIENFSIEDEGNYTCEVSETGKETTLATHYFNVMIGKPYFLAKWNLTKTDIIEGQKINLDCHAQDNLAKIENHPVLVEWIYNAKPINESSFFTASLISDDTFTLTIDKSEIKHIGNYGCKVTNNNGSVYQETSLNVAQRIPCTCTNQSAANVTRLSERGKNVTFTCPVTGFPEPKFVWGKNGITLTNGTMDGRIILLEESRNTLTIIKVNETDAGEYLCTAICEEQNNLTSGFDLKIDVHPPIQPSNIIIWIIVIIIIVIIVSAILFICKKRGYARRIYDLRKRERQAANNQQDPRTAEQSEVSLLAGESSRNATLNLQRKNTQNGISLSEVQSQA